MANQCTTIKASKDGKWKCHLTSNFAMIGLFWLPHLETILKTEVHGISWFSSNMSEKCTLKLFIKYWKLILGSCFNNFVEKISFLQTNLSLSENIRASTSLIISKKKISQREKKQPWKFYVSQIVVDLAENA